MQNTQKIATMVAFAVSVAFSSSAQAVDVTWIGPDGGFWNVGGNWNGQNIPSNGDSVMINPPTSQTVVYNTNLLNPGLISLEITGAGAVSTTLNQQQNTTLTVSGNTRVGISGTGIFNQTGGTHTVGNELFLASRFSNTPNVAGTGTYNLSDGILTVAEKTTVGLDGQGTFNQSGGTHETKNLDVGRFGIFPPNTFSGFGNGTYNLSGDGKLMVSNLTRVGRGGIGVFEQNGGTFTTGSLSIGVGGAVPGGQTGPNKGTYNLSAGNLTAGSEIIGDGGGLGTFNQTGGSHSVTDTLTVNSGSAYHLGGGTLNATKLLNNANFDFSGGALTVAQFINTGAVNLSGAGTRVLGGNVTNQSNFNITGTTAQFKGTFNNTVGGSLSGTGQVINSGALNYSGGSISTGLTNTGTGTVNLSGTGNRIFGGNVTNQGTFKVTDTTATFTGNFDNQGAYLSDPSVNNFQDLTVGQQGFLVGGPNDQFIVTGDFANASTQNTSWNTSQSTLVFANGTSHQMALASADLGPAARSFLNNFAWGQVALGSGQSLNLVDGNATPGAALYTSRLTLGNGISQLSSISGNYNIYYDPSQNQNLSGSVFNFGSGSGQLIPQDFTFLPSDAAPGVTTNERSFAGALDSACSSASGDLEERCRELRVLSSDQRQEAIASLTPIQQLSQIATPIKLNFARMDAPMIRMAQLRSGHIQPGTLSFNGNQISLNKLTSALNPKAWGGAAGDPVGLDEPIHDKPFGVFVQGKFNFGNQTNNPDSFGFDVDSRAVTVGSDYRFNDKFIAGAAIEYNDVHTRFRHDGGSMQTNTITGALYSSYYLPKDFYVDGLATFGNNEYKMTRTFNYPGFNSSASSNPDAFQYAFALTAGKDIAWHEWLFNPYTRFEYIQLEIDGYKESGGGGGFAMNVGPQNINSAISALGTQISYNISQPWGILVPSIRFEWEHQYLNNNQQIPMTLASAAAGAGNFVIQTGQPDRDYVNLGGSISATLPGGGTAFLRYDTRLGQSYISNHIVEVGIKIPF